MSLSFRFSYCLRSRSGRGRAAGAGATRAAPPDTPAEKQPERTTGLPSSMKWTFNFDAGLGHVRVRQLALQQPQGTGRRREPERPVVRGLRQAGAVRASTRSRPRASSTARSAPSASGPTARCPQPSARTSRRSGPRISTSDGGPGTSLALGENAIDFTVGRAPYQLGHGFLLYDGAAEGGSRGGYWTNARKAFQFAAIGRFKPGLTRSRRSISTRTSSRRTTPAAGCGALNYEFATGKDDTRRSARRT